MLNSKSDYIKLKHTNCMPCNRLFLISPPNTQEWAKPTNWPPKNRAGNPCANSQVELKSCHQGLGPRKLQEDCYFYQMQLQFTWHCPCWKTTDKSSSYNTYWIPTELVIQFQSLSITIFSISLHSYCSPPSPIFSFPNKAKTPEIQNGHIKYLVKGKKKKKFSTQKCKEGD